MNRICAATFALFLSAAPALGQDLSGQEPLESDCGWFMSQAGGIKMVEDPDLHVLEQTRGDFKPKGHVEGRLGIYCTRSDIVPAKNDYKLLMAGYPFNIYAPIGDKVSALVLEINGGRLQTRLIVGDKLPPDVQTRISAYLDTAQPYFYKK